MPCGYQGAHTVQYFTDKMVTGVFVDFNQFHVVAVANRVQEWQPVLRHDAEQRGG